MKAVLRIIGAPPAFPGGLPVLYFLSQARLRELPQEISWIVRKTAPPASTALWEGACV